MFNLKKMGLTPAKPDWDWDQADETTWDGCFKGSPDALLPTIRHYFSNLKVRPKTFTHGAGFVCKDVMDRTITLEPSKYPAHPTIIRIEASKRAAADFETARDHFMRIGVPMSEPTDTRDWTSCRALMLVNQSQWNRAVRPLFDAGWDAKMVHEVQQVKRGPISVQMHPRETTLKGFNVTIFWFK